MSITWEVNTSYTQIGAKTNMFCFWPDFVLREGYTLFLLFHFTLGHVHVHILYGLVFLIF